MTAITGADGNSVYIPVLILQETRYTTISSLPARMVEIVSTGLGDAGHTPQMDIYVPPLSSDGRK